MKEFPASSELSGGDDDGGFHGGEETEITVRQWLSQPNRVVDRAQSLHIFKQVLDFVDLAHGQGVMLRNIRPSCFLLSPLNKVAFIDSASTPSSQQSSGDDQAQRPQQQAPEPENHHHQHRRQWMPERSGSTGSEGERRDAGSGNSSGSGKAVDTDNSDDNVVRFGEHCFPQRQLLQMELAWYTSPEEHATGSSTFASDIYSLGVLMFEVIIFTPNCSYFQGIHVFFWFPKRLLLSKCVHV